MPEYRSSSSKSSIINKKMRIGKSIKKQDTKKSKTILFGEGKPWERKWTLNSEYTNWKVPIDEPLFFKWEEERITEDTIEDIKKYGIRGGEIVGKGGKFAKGLRLEYIIEYTRHVLARHPEDFFPTFQDFMKAVNKARVISIPSDEYISNRSMISTPRGLVSEISWQETYGKFKSEKLLNTLQERIESNLPMDMPIVLEFPSGDWELMSGNSRFALALINKMPTIDVLVIPTY